MRSSSGVKASLKALFWVHFRAVFLKNLSLESRQTKLLIFQVLPMVVIFLIVGIVTKVRPDAGQDLGMQVSIPGLTEGSGQDFFKNLRPSSKWSPYTYTDSTGNAGYQINHTKLPTGPGFLGAIPQQMYSDDLGGNYTYGAYVPYFTKFPSWDSVKANFSATLNSVRGGSGQLFNNQFATCKYIDTGSTDSSCDIFYQMPIAGYAFDAASREGNVSFAYRLNAGKTLWKGSYYGAYRQDDNVYITILENSPYDAISFLNSAFLRWLVDKVNVTFSQYSINAGVAPVFLVIENNNLRANIFGQFCGFAIALSLIYPFFMHRIVIERSIGLMEVSRMAGLTTASYWFSLVFSDYLHYLLAIVAVSLIGVAFAFEFIFRASLVLIPTLVLGGFAVLPVSYFFAVMFKTTNKAFIFAYLFGSVQAIASIMLNLLYLNPGAVAPAWFSFFPPFALHRALFVIAHRAAVPQLVTEALMTHTVLVSLAYMVGFSLVFFILALYVDQIVPRSEGMKRPFYFPITDALTFLGCLRSNEIFEGDGNEHVVLDTKLSEEDLDDDVAEEKLAVISKTFPEKGNPVVLIDGLTKAYSVPGGKPFKAVQGVWLHINDGECFGLLGPNGAGKTTLVNMLVGLLLPSSGRANIGGFPISQNAFTASSVIGLCPQFDILYDDLTVEEHLLFYVRLKGFPQSGELAHVQQIIDEIGLQGERRRLAQALSGGQRRRLSIGIALAGDPQFVLLDEPTSGLDPGSKRAVWDVIRQARSKRCFLLTTHSMEEAEVLCTRIGIMAGGELKCLGTQQHLKSKYGEGFKIDVMYQSGERDKADTFITSTIPEAKLSVSSEGYLSYQAPKSIQLSLIFTKIESQKRRHGIITWGISQANLEQVFLTIVKQAETQTAPMPFAAMQ